MPECQEPSRSGGAESARIRGYAQALMTSNFIVFYLSSGCCLLGRLPWVASQFPDYGHSKWCPRNHRPCAVENLLKIFLAVYYSGQHNKEIRITSFTSSTVTTRGGQVPGFAESKSDSVLMAKIPVVCMLSLDALSSHRSAFKLSGFLTVFDRILSSPPGIFFPALNNGKQDMNRLPVPLLSKLNVFKRVQVTLKNNRTEPLGKGR